MTSSVMPFGVPVEFLLFGAMLLGVAMVKRGTLYVSLGGLAAILAYQAAFSAFPTGQGWPALALHARNGLVL